MTVRSAASDSAQPGRRPAYALRYASFESRLVAAVLDLLVVFIIAALFITAGAMIILVSSEFEKVDPSGTAIDAFWICAGAILPATLLYFFVGLAWKGQTIGHSVMQIMVLRSDGRPLGVLGSVARVIGLLVYVVLAGAGALGAYAFRDSGLQAAVSIGVPLFLATMGVLWAAFDKHRRCLHDRLAGTIVVRVG
ncbi:MAG: RDD family protein [Chloroflexi bacterium]|nr:RDD family protein [Chloroflexota bacterium]